MSVYGTAYEIDPAKFFLEAEDQRLLILTDHPHHLSDLALRISLENHPTGLDALIQQGDHLPFSVTSLAKTSQVQEY